MAAPPTYYLLVLCDSLVCCGDEVGEEREYNLGIRSTLRYTEYVVITHTLISIIQSINQSVRGGGGSFNETMTRSRQSND